MLPEKDVNIIFGGYAPRMRNAIAHSTFHYDSIENKMIFENFQKTDGTLEWSSSLGLSTILGRYADKIHAINSMVLDYLALLGVFGRAILA